MMHIGAEVRFKSIPSAYWLEKKGIKNHTERLITAEDEKWLKEHRVERIQISNAADPGLFYFTREITNIFKEGSILGYYLYSFTWKHEEDTK